MPESRAQVRAAHSVLEGNSGLFSKKFAQDVVSGMHGKKMSSLPERKRGGRVPMKNRGKK